MPALFIFLFKVNIALVLFCLGYYLVLRHLTFYTLNRIYLVAAILFSTLYPNINLTNFAQQHQRLTQPVQTVILNWKAPAEKFVKPLYQPNYWQWVEAIFWAGVILFAARLLMQLFSLYKLYRQSKPGQVQEHAVRLISDDIGPFSFWRSIYINPTKLSPSELKSVLEHEQVHVSQWHTLDILLAELSTIFYWFNPGVWLMKKAVRENVEFITDRKILQKGTDTKEYQYSLLSVSLAAAPNTIVNHFNLSTIKKRIIMMNAKRSAGYTLTRYVFLVPAVIALLLVFSFSKAEVAKKGLSTIKSITKAIATITIVPNDKPQVAPKKAPINQAKEVKPLADSTPVKLKLSTTDTIYSGKSKDGKRSILMTTDKSLDSVSYVINGVISSRANFLAIDPKNYKQLDLETANYAKGFINDLPNKPYVLFVTTDDSATGELLKEKMDKFSGGGKLATVNNTDIKGVGNSTDIAPAVVGDGSSYSAISSSSDSAPAVSVYGSKNMSSSVVVVTDSKAMTKTMVRHVNVAPKVNVSVSDVKIDGLSENIAPVFSVTPDGNKIQKVYITKTPKSNKYTVDDMSSKLIIIDGKESKNLNKVPVSDIKSLTILNGDAATSAYGDKAKNGVVVITTKKGK